jgi:steroid delta-isomerase-like uncharacterized protein
MGSDADVIRRVTDEAFIGGKLDVIDEMFADDFVDHDPLPGMPGDKTGQKAIAEMVVNAFSDRKAEVDEYVETTDGRVVENWVMVGTHTGEFAGMPPSNQSIRVRGIEIWRCADGKITEHWGAVDLSDVAEKAAGS